MDHQKLLRSFVDQVLAFNDATVQHGWCPLCRQQTPHAKTCPMQLLAAPMVQAQGALAGSTPERVQSDEEAAAAWEQDQDTAEARADGLVVASYYKALAENGMPAMIAGQLTAMWVQKH